jgi:hypothetical protein
MSFGGRQRFLAGSSFDSFHDWEIAEESFSLLGMNELRTGAIGGAAVA